MRWRLLALILTVVALGAAPAPVAAAADCRVGDRLLAEGELNRAETVYSVLGCAVGVTAVREQRGAADELVKAAVAAKPAGGELPPAARAQVEAAVTLDADNAIARALLASMGPARVDDLCRKGGQALRAGDWQQARELYQTAKDVESAKACALEGTARAEQMRLSSWPARVEALAVGYVLPWLGLAVVAFFLALALVASVRNGQFDRWGQS